MSTQKRAFEIHKPIRFGKYSSLSVVQIYSGTGELPAAYCKNYLLDALKFFKPLEEDYTTFFQVEIADGLVKVSVNPQTRYYKGIYFNKFDFCREVNNVLHEFESGFPFDWYNGYELEDDRHRSYSQDEERGEKEDLIHFAHDEDVHHILRYGKPRYIDWLVNNVDFFSLAPEDLDALEQLDVLEFYGLYLKKVDEGVYSMNQSFLKLKKKFGANIKLLNEKKWNAFVERREQTSVSESYESRGSSWSSSRNRDFYSDDDEDQIMRGLSNGDGDLFGF
jgi:hypothetical protein